MGNGSFLTTEPQKAAPISVWRKLVGIALLLGLTVSFFGFIVPRPAGPPLSESELALSLPPVPENDDFSRQSENIDCPALRQNATYRGKDKIFKYILPGKEGWLFRSVDFRQDFSISEDALSSFQSIGNSLASRNIRLVILLQPPRGFFASAHMNPSEIPSDYDSQTARRSYRNFIHQLESRGLSVVDLSDVPSESAYFMKADPHWSVSGARYSAQKTADLIRMLPGYKTIEKERFSTRITKQEKHERGDFEEFALRTCKIDRTPVFADIWETTPDEEKTGQDALFGEAPLPQIVALGTSNTENDRELNFVGSLKVLLSADIENAALAGGGLGGSPIAYFSSDAFQARQPKIVLWEFLAHHDFEDQTALRQISGAVNGPCSSENTVASYDGSFLPSATSADLPDFPESSGNDKKADLPVHKTIFADLDKKAPFPENHYLYLETSEPLERDIRVGVLYSNGDAEEVDLTRSRRSPNSGKYFLSFNEASGATPILVELATDKAEGAFSARICRTPMSDLARRD